ncbi:serine hydrolase [Streptomyces kanamyceticus]|uniref:serine hydrolase n=1 Tax=Streptomyces kanamyceticus TaxID=1967 RepID=UPI000A7EADFF|nr:serine hydrolase [Streptomyces kanamyceticus]
MNDVNDVNEQIATVFEEAGAQGFLHAREVGPGTVPEVAFGADAPVVLASVFKIPVAVAYAREVAAGRLDERERTTIPARYRIGGIGTAGCADDVEMTWRDVALFMLTMSDNAATDVLCHRLGRVTVEKVLAELGLSRTRLTGCCEDLFASLAADLGVVWGDMAGPGGEPGELERALAAATPEQIWQSSVLDPARTSASTPRDITELLDAIWTDRAGAPEACERVRSMMRRQIWPHRLTSGFASDVTIAAKTGTLPAVRNEAGVVAYPDGRRFAVAVFTRAATLDDRLPAVDASIGRAARIAVDHLRQPAGRHG